MSPQEYHYDNRRLRFLFETKSGATPKSTVDEYWDGGIYWVTPEDLGKLCGTYLSDTRRKISEEGYRNSGVEMAPAASLVLSKRAPIGQTAILKVDATCSQGCFLLVNKGNVDERFFYYTLLHLRPYLEILGRGSTFMELSTEDLRSVCLPYPDHGAQHRIADYLDHETARIDALVAEKEKMLALLEEKRTALISRAVTRGLDPDVYMKPTGLDWLGDIPEHWFIRRIKFISDFLDQGSSPVAANTPAGPGELGVLKLSAISKGRFRREENKALKESDGTEQLLSLRKDDVLITRGNTPDLVADVAFVPSDEPNLLLPDLIYKLRVCASDVLPEYVTYFLITPLARLQIRRDARGSSGSMVKVSQGHVLNWQITLPPLQEQDRIVSQIKQAEDTFNFISQEIIESVYKLKERRSALITAAVTGQLNLKGMAA